MEPGFRELDGITADLGIEAWGEDLEEAFSQAILGLAAIMADPPGTGAHAERSLSISAPGPDSLLVNLLNEVIYLGETERFLPLGIVEMVITDDCIQATLAGTVLDPDLHPLKTHVKAATYHELSIDESSGGAKVRVIFDV